MPEQEGKPFVYVPCPLCQGSVFDGQRLCQHCRERGMYAWHEGDYLYWGRKIDTLHILEEEIERAVKMLINGFLIFFGVIGVIGLFITMMRFSSGTFSAQDFFSVRSSLMGIFAITLLTDLYAYYRLQRESLMERNVKPRQFETLLTVEDPSVLFEQIKTVDPKKIIDIAPAYTIDAHQAVVRAWQFARKLGHAEVTPLHLFGTVLSYPHVQVVLGRLGLNGQALVQKISRSIQRIPQARTADVRFSADFRKTLLRAYIAAYDARQERVDVQHLLLAVATVDDMSRDILYDMEAELDDVINVVEWVNIQHRLSEQWHRRRIRAAYKSKGPMNRSMTSQATPLLDRFSNDMTSLARIGALEPCIGREREIEGTLRIMEGGKNVLLVGNPGVGKKSIVQGIAELMAAEEVPEVLQDMRFVSVSVASLVGAAGRQGELEGVLLQLINEVVRSGNIVLFIDNIQNMIGVSTQGAENLDISDIFASALAKKLFYCIATTTPSDFRRYVEPSSSLTSVFQNVTVDELDRNGTVRVLEGKVGAVEAKNQVYFSYDALNRAVMFAERYIQDRNQPEKSIAIIDEVGVYVRRKKGKDAIATGEDVAEVVSTRTNVPVTKLTEKESEKLLKLEEYIHKRMVNQEEAVTAVSTALRRARAELRDIRRPIVNLLFLGPTGVGKTELAKTVAEVYFGSEDTMIRVDMSEYQEKSSINRLIGAPPGHGSESGGYLTDAVRSQPFSLVLLDEFEKAHPDILNVFLQVMDDGRLTDTAGRTVDFTNVILIATSNAGTSLIQDRIKENIPLDQIKDELINQALRPIFRPELLNRFDNIIVFRPLSFEHIVKIVDLMLIQVAKRLSTKGIKLEATQEAKVELAELGFDPVFGARPLRRAIQDQVDNALATYLLQGRIGRRDVAVLEQGGRISIRQAKVI
ncbi:MAG: ATP-dependent Clp protease ATP-binding subunit [Patescibacteria group bacterium]|nr:ATP-dependent Clp protease ATP-binding subunit [Patescibacteria group bacterium]MDD5716152.1 ATP-dependent Clp protease ATP-binding subunit [Patescibacteria group bacterium]